MQARRSFSAGPIKLVKQAGLNGLAPADPREGRGSARHEAVGMLSPCARRADEANMSVAASAALPAIPRYKTTRVPV